MINLSKTAPLNNTNRSNIADFEHGNIKRPEDAALQAECDVDYRWASLSQDQLNGLVADTEILSLLKKVADGMDSDGWRQAALHLSGSLEMEYAPGPLYLGQYLVKPESQSVLKGLLDVRADDDSETIKVNLQTLRARLEEQAQVHDPAGDLGSINLDNTIGSEAFNTFKRKILKEFETKGSVLAEENSLLASEPPPRKPSSAFEALASGQLGFIEEQLRNPKLTGEQVFELLTPKDKFNHSGLQCLIGTYCPDNNGVKQKVGAFRKYVNLLDKHAPQLTAVQLNALYKYLHEAQREPRNFFRHNSKAYNQLKRHDEALYQQFKNVKSICSQASRVGRSDLEDQIYRAYSKEINEMKVKLSDPKLTSEQRFDCLAASQENSFLRSLLNEPSRSAFSIAYKRAALKEYMGVLGQAATELFTEQRRSLYKHLHDLQKSYPWSRKHADYKAMMKDLELYREYKALKNNLKVGERAPAMKVKESEDSDKEGVNQVADDAEKSRT
jgi:hypothetical protein